MQRKLGTINTPDDFLEMVKLLDQNGLPMSRPEIATWVEKVFEVNLGGHENYQTLEAHLNTSNMLERVFASIDGLKSGQKIVLDDDREYADDADDLRMK